MRTSFVHMGHGETMPKYFNVENAISIFEILADKCADDKAFEQAISVLKDVTPADVVEVIRCKDCKHRPVDTVGNGDGFDIEFPDYVCPCQVEDPYYSWVPKDDWFCPDGERKEDDGRDKI